MPLVPITVMGYRCERCGNEWVPRTPEREPGNCPKCKSPYWNKPRRKEAPPMTYVSFRDAIKDVLEQSGKALTWTEIRTAAQLPQMFPNNKWVRDMESDIALRRERGRDGIIRWDLPRGDNDATDRGTQTPERLTQGSGRKAR